MKLVISAKVKTAWSTTFQMQADTLPAEAVRLKVPQNAEGSGMGQSELGCKEHDGGQF